MPRRRTVLAAAGTALAGVAGCARPSDSTPSLDAGVGDPTTHDPFALVVRRAARTRFDGFDGPHWLVDLQLKNVSGEPVAPGQFLDGVRAGRPGDLSPRVDPTFVRQILDTGLRPGEVTRGPLVFPASTTRETGAADDATSRTVRETSAPRLVVDLGTGPPTHVGLGRADGPVTALDDQSPFNYVGEPASYDGLRVRVGGVTIRGEASYLVEPRVLLENGRAGPVPFDRRTDVYLKDSTGRCWDPSIIQAEPDYLADGALTPGERRTGIVPFLLRESAVDRFVRVVVDAGEAGSARHLARVEAGRPSG